MGYVITLPNNGADHIANGSNAVVSEGHLFVYEATSSHPIAVYTPGSWVRAVRGGEVVNSKAGTKRRIDVDQPPSS